MSRTYSGSVHDKKICDEEELYFPKGEIKMYLDLGYVGYAPKNVEIVMPIKKPKGKELTDAQKDINKGISSKRVIIEHMIAGVKRFRIVKDKIRLRRPEIRDLVMEIAVATHNFRTKQRKIANQT